MITNDQLIGFVKRWRELEETRKQYEFALATLMREIRACFASGQSGDDKFVTWVCEELRQNESQARELLRRAHAAQVVPDAATWSEHGARAVYRLAELPAPKRASALSQAKSTGYALTTVLNRMANGPAASPSLGLRQSQTLSTTVTLNTVTRDATTLADYIRLISPTIPSHIAKVLDRYPTRAPQSGAVVRRRARP